MPNDIIPVSCLFNHVILCFFLCKDISIFCFSLRSTVCPGQKLFFKIELFLQETGLFHAFDVTLVVLHCIRKSLLKTCHLKLAGRIIFGEPFAEINYLFEIADRGRIVLLQVPGDRVG